MLNELLREIDKGGTLSSNLLAARLNTSPGLIEMMLEDLERRGKLRRVAAGCDTVNPCGDCPVSSSCAPQTRVWTRVTQRQE